MWLLSPFYHTEWLDSTTTSKQWGPSEGGWASPESWGQTRPSGQGEDRMGQCIGQVVYQAYCEPEAIFTTTLPYETFSAQNYVLAGMRKREKHVNMLGNQDKSWCNVSERPDKDCWPLYAKHPSVVYMSEQIWVVLLSHVYIQVSYSMLDCVITTV